VLRNEKLRQGLSDLMQDLNRKVEKSNFELGKGGVMPQHDKNKIEQMILYRENELNSQKITLNMYLQHYDSFASKSQDKYTHQK
jgi:hypothetical protein